MLARPRLFVGSSAEALHIARNLEVELDAAKVCDVERWDRDVFEPGGYTLDSLLEVASRVDFAVLIASPDDRVESRGETSHAPRDNVLLEFGMFVGALGRQRAFLLATDRMRLPSDVNGLTRLSYSIREDENVRKALNPAVVQIEDRVKRLGRRSAVGVVSVEAPATDRDVLEREIDLVCANARAQGWTVKTNSDTTLRLRNPQGSQFSLQNRSPDQTRVELRRFAAKLRGVGLRVNSAVRRPVESSPL